MLRTRLLPLTSLAKRRRPTPHTNACGFAMMCARHMFSTWRKEDVMAKGQMRSNKEKKKPKADKNIKKGGATPSPFSSGKTPTVQSLNSKK